MLEITITVKCSNDTKYSVTIDPSKTVLEFKQAIAAKSDTPAERQRLIYSGKVLKDADTLDTYKIADGQTVHMVKGSAPGGTSSQSSGGQQTRTTPPVNSQPTPQTNTSPGNPFAAFGLNQFGGLGQGFGSAGLGAGTGGVNPMDAILQNPAMVQMMSQMLRDPQLLESMISASPQLSSMAPQIRQYMQNPEFQALLSNPEALRQMAAMSSLMGGNLGPFTGGFSDLGGLAGTTNPIPPSTSTNPLLDLWGLAAGGGGTAPPEERFQVQLQQLNEMGFWNAQQNIRALLLSGGNVPAAVELLLSGSIVVAEDGENPIPSGDGFEDAIIKRLYGRRSVSDCKSGTVCKVEVQALA
ncbi:5443_t:CDS:2 [Ambispora gerdemannii]|uniref:5443_t:CDS:1 n=1 Tax=Ambispora gerdemannii TaxID=144530 RepID=A0A9N8ZHL1_9GLOM|nr:5443_t:CDS:2 [Ambispora gerdemannii]